MREPERDKSCERCRWYHDAFGVCCCPDSEYAGITGERCELYDFLGTRQQTEEWRQRKDNDTLQALSELWNGRGESTPGGTVG